jgi:hypothetical protein
VTSADRFNLCAEDEQFIKDFSRLEGVDMDQTGITWSIDKCC